MVPVRLELKNFMSYGENVAPIDFEGMHVACLSGENGHGKTAILDAMTWALWGQARASTDELIRIGSTDMSVVFDFELGGNLYRVIKAASKKRNAGVWELQASDGSGGFKPVTGQGIRDTKRQIERLLKMDYRTFINSAYIQQGKADEFTRQTVGNRKKVLADILDLSRYDELAKVAKEERDKAQEKAETLRQEIARLDAELSVEEEIKTSLASAKEDLERARRVISVEESALRTLEKRKAELESEQVQALKLQAESESAQSEVRTLEERLASAQKRVEADEVLLDQKEKIHAGYQTLEDARRSEFLMEQAKDQLLSLQSERSMLEHALSEEKHVIELKLQLAESEYSGARARLDERAYLEDEVESLTLQLAEVAPAGVDLITRDTCRLECRTAQAQQMLYVLSKTEELLPGLKNRVHKLREQVDSPNGSEVRHRLAEVDRQMARLHYDQQEHTRLRESIKEMAEWERLKLEMEQARIRLPEDRANEAVLRELIEAKLELIQRDDEALATVEGKLSSMAEVENELQSVFREIADLRKEAEELTAQYAVYEHRLKGCSEFRMQRQQVAGALASAEADVSAYIELAKAFGRSGVQSLIIENAVPEIQEEANEILSRMTDGNMRVSLDTLRETKINEVVETLDVRIKDEVGDRGYELLSGGEAFRVNFALRIALSKLLARRAGARLETLVIDEGFGTQDGKGREKLVEAIDAIKGEFRRILVITHIEELKDAFPTRIEVYKDQEGSQVTVV